MPSSIESDFCRADGDDVVLAQALLGRYFAAIQIGARPTALWHDIIFFVTVDDITLCTGNQPAFDNYIAGRILAYLDAGLAVEVYLLGATPTGPSPITVRP